MFDTITDAEALAVAKAFNAVWRKPGPKDARYEALLAVTSRRLASELSSVSPLSIPEQAGNPAVRAHVEDQVLVVWPLTKKRVATMSIGRTDVGVRVVALGMDQAGVTPTLPGKPRT